MDTSVFGLDLTGWLSTTSDTLYVAGFCLALLAIMLVTCIMAQMMTREDHAATPKDKARLAHSNLNYGSTKSS
jgi:hypothetical protein